MVDSREIFLKSKDRDWVDLALAARMVIGYTYSPEDPDIPDTADFVQLGVRNGLIQLLNYSVLDVDRLDYMVRDARMSGFFNAPLDLERLAASVTAIRDPKIPGTDLLLPAYRDSALSVFDLMFQAKLSHDTWVLANPVGPYEAGLIAHCIRNLAPDYIEKVFSRGALSRDGIIYNNKTYRLLSDVDVSADLKSHAFGSDPNYTELYTRELGVHRTPAWRSYHEYYHLFSDIGPDKVYEFFAPLLKFMEENNLIIFDEATWNLIHAQGNTEAMVPAGFLRDYLISIANKDQKEQYNVVLLDRTNHFTLKLDPAQIYIVFSKKNIPLCQGGRNYSSYSQLNGIVKQHRTAKYFYLFRHGSLGSVQLPTFRDELKKLI